MGRADRRSARDACRAWRRGEQRNVQPGRFAHPHSIGRCDGTIVERRHRSRSRYTLGTHGPGCRRGIQRGRLPRRHRVLRQDRAQLGRRDGRRRCDAFRSRGLGERRSVQRRRLARRHCLLDNTARVWDAKRGWAMAALAGHADRVLAAAFSPDGARVVTASADKTARVWDAATGDPIAVRRGTPTR